MTGSGRTYCHSRGLGGRSTAGRRLRRRSHSPWSGRRRAGSSFRPVTPHLDGWTLAVASPSKGFSSSTRQSAAGGRGRLVDPEKSAGLERLDSVAVEASCFVEGRGPPHEKSRDVTLSSDQLSVVWERTLTHKAKLVVAPERVNVRRCSLKIGVSVVNAGDLVDPDAAVELAQHAEGVGIESLWAVEHVVVPYGYAAQY